MKDFARRIAILDRGSGMGRQLVRRFVADACDLAMCDFVRAGDGGNAAPVLVGSTSTRSDR
jgi:hypothetical protein